MTVRCGWCWGPRGHVAESSSGGSGWRWSYQRLTHCPERNRSSGRSLRVRPVTLAGTWPVWAPGGHGPVHSLRSPASVGGGPSHDPLRPLLTLSFPSPSAHSTHTLLRALRGDLAGISGPGCQAYTSLAAGLFWGEAILWNARNGFHCTSESLGFGFSL